MPEAVVSHGAQKTLYQTPTCTFKKALPGVKYMLKIHSGTLAFKTHFLADFYRLLMNKKPPPITQELYKWSKIVLNISDL